MFTNVGEAFIKNMQLIYSEGEEIVTRENKQLEILAHHFVIEKPWERVILTPYRNNNIFALIAETLWVMAGRNDIDFLTHYLPRAIDYSDDGKTWRAGYGPRLRNWNGIDQFKCIIERMEQEKTTKRAVISIFDPGQDFISDTKDVPCNNWLNFLIRNNKLHLNVAVRANDIMWGFGGINSFEWSVLQEIMAFWNNVNVGSLSWFAGSLHLYEPHYKRGQKIIIHAQEKCIYDYDIQSLPFSTKFDTFDSLLKECFTLENAMRTQEDGVLEKIELINDEFMKACMKMLYIYNKYLAHAPMIEIINLINSLPVCDFRVAAIEFFSRKEKCFELFSLSENEKDFFANYWCKL